MTVGVSNLFDRRYVEHLSYQRDPVPLGRARARAGTQPVRERLVPLLTSARGPAPPLAPALARGRRRASLRQRRIRPACLLESALHSHGRARVTETTKYNLPDSESAEGLVQHPGGPAVRASADAAPRHQAADRPRRPRAALPDGAHPAGGLEGALDRDPRPGARRAAPVAAVAALPCPAAGGEAPDARPHLLQARGREPRGLAQAQHRRSRRRTTTRKRASTGSPPRPAPASGAARSPSRASSSASRSRSTWCGSATTRSRTAAT